MRFLIENFTLSLDIEPLSDSGQAQALQLILDQMPALIQLALSRQHVSAQQMAAAETLSVKLPDIDIQALLKTPDWIARQIAQSVAQALASDSVHSSHSGTSVNSASSPDFSKGLISWLTPAQQAEIFSQPQALHDFLLHGLRDGNLSRLAPSQAEFIAFRLLQSLSPHQSLLTENSARGERPEQIPALQLSESVLPDTTPDTIKVSSSRTVRETLIRQLHFHINHPLVLNRWSCFLWKSGQKQAAAILLSLLYGPDKLPDSDLMKLTGQIQNRESITDVTLAVASLKNNPIQHERRRRFSHWLNLRALPGLTTTTYTRLQQLLFSRCEQKTLDAAITLINLARLRPLTPTDQQTLARLIRKTPAMAGMDNPVLPVAGESLETGGDNNNSATTAIHTQPHSASASVNKAEPETISQNTRSFSKTLHIWQQSGRLLAGLPQFFELTRFLEPTELFGKSQPEQHNFQQILSAEQLIQLLDNLTKPLPIPLALLTCEIRLALHQWQQNLLPSASFRLREYLSLLLQKNNLWQPLADNSLAATGTVPASFLSCAAEICNDLHQQIREFTSYLQQIDPPATKVLADMEKTKSVTGADSAVSEEAQNHFNQKKFTRLLAYLNETQEEAQQAEKSLIRRLVLLIRQQQDNYRLQAEKQDAADSATELNREIARNCLLLSWAPLRLSEQLKFRELCRDLLCAVPESCEKYHSQFRQMFHSLEKTFGTDKTVFPGKEDNEHQAAVMDNSEKAAGQGGAISSAVIGDRRPSSTGTTSASYGDTHLNSLSSTETPAALPGALPGTDTLVRLKTTEKNTEKNTEDRHFNNDIPERENQDVLIRTDTSATAPVNEDRHPYTTQNRHQRYGIKDAKTEHSIQHSGIFTHLFTAAEAAGIEPDILNLLMIQLFPGEPLLERPSAIHSEPILPAKASPKLPVSKEIFSEQQTAGQQPSEQQAILKPLVSEWLDLERHFATQTERKTGNRVVKQLTLWLKENASSIGKSTDKQAVPALSHLRKDAYPGHYVKNLKHPNQDKRQETDILLTEARRVTAEKIQQLSSCQLSEEQWTPDGGLILLWPFLSTLFNRLSLLITIQDDKGKQIRQFASDTARLKGYLILIYLLGLEEIPDGYAGVANLLVGFEADTVVDAPEQLIETELTDNDKQEADNMLTVAISRWQALKEMSPPAFQQLFLQRQACIEPSGLGFNIQVEKQTIDILIDKLPWGVGMIRLPWLGETALSVIYANHTN